MVSLSFMRGRFRGARNCPHYIRRIAWHLTAKEHAVGSMDSLALLETVIMLAHDALASRDMNRCEQSGWAGRVCSLVDVRRTLVATS